MSRASRRPPALVAVQWGILAGLIVAGVLAWTNRTALADDVRLWNYRPPADVAALAGQIGFTDTGRRYFYASHPLIEDRAAFSASCGNTEAHQTVLGCYTHDSIYVYDVTDARLAGVQEVTAAHEMLHAAYARLSGSERSRVDAMVQREYDSLSGDRSFAQRFAVYGSLSQADKLNELHSIFGTEVSPLSGDLETYYKTYFTDRGIVTGDYTAYQGQFDALKSQQTALRAQIDTLKGEIQGAETAYESDRQALDADIQAFNRKASGGGYSRQADFESDRAALAGRADALNQAAAAINAKVDAYAAAISRYNALGVQAQDLENSLDSGPVQAAPSV